VGQKKTGQPVWFELTEQTRETLDSYLTATGKKPGEFLFPGRGGHNRCMSTRQYARLVSRWIGAIGLNPSFLGTHSLRRTKATLLPPHRQPACRAVAPGAHKDREHDSLSRNRGRRRPCHSGTS
jgi:integrase